MKPHEADQPSSATLTPLAVTLFQIRLCINFPLETAQGAN